MPAANYYELLQFEDSIESAVVSVLNANGLTAVRQRGNTSLATPRVEVRMITGAAEEHYGYDAAGEPFVNFWHATIQLAIVTNRSRNDASHTTYRGKCRWLMQRLALFNTDVLLPYHTIERILESGTSPEIQPDENHDASVVSFAVDFCIRNDAYPTP
jgi:hypothetical protein